MHLVNPHRSREYSEGAAFTTFLWFFSNTVILEVKPTAGPRGRLSCCSTFWPQLRSTLSLETIPVSNFWSEHWHRLLTLHLFFVMFSVENHVKAPSCSNGPRKTCLFILRRVGVRPKTHKTTNCGPFSLQPSDSDCFDLPCVTAAVRRAVNCKIQTNRDTIQEHWIVRHRGRIIHLLISFD